MNMKASMPGFSAELALGRFGNYDSTQSEKWSADLANIVVPAFPIHCKTVCAWRVCGSALPGYPPPMCYSCEQECWLHGDGPYSSASVMSIWSL